LNRPALPQRDYLIGLGSNYRAEHWLPWALNRLRAHFESLRHSSPEYSRDAQAVIHNPLASTYLNAAAVVRCDWPSWRFERLLKSLEAQAGRSATLKAAGLVPLDLDLLGRARIGQNWKFAARRQRDLSAAYMQTHLADVLGD
jgi:7,8-dihydro-6-hydroxymethylpterin-pyrophosphokinase